MSNYLLRFLVFGQPLLFMLLYEYSYKIYDGKYLFSVVDFEIELKVIFIVLSLKFLLFVIENNVSFDYYTPNLFIQYVFLVWYAFYRFNKENNVIRSIALSFLIVFLNSYYWELFLHVADYNTSFSAIFNVRELWHLIVVPFLLSHYDIDKKVFVRYTMINVLVGYIVFMFNFHLFRLFGLYWIHFPIFNSWINLFNCLNRFISLFILINLIIDGGKVNHKYWWF